MNILTKIILVKFLGNKCNTKVILSIGSLTPTSDNDNEGNLTINFALTIGFAVHLINGVPKQIF